MYKRLKAIFFSEMAKKEKADQAQTAANQEPSVVKGLFQQMGLMKKDPVPAPVSGLAEKKELEEEKKIEQASDVEDEDEDVDEDDYDDNGEYDDDERHSTQCNALRCNAINDASQCNAMPLHMQGRATQGQAMQTRAKPFCKMLTPLANMCEVNVDDYRLLDTA